MIISASYRTDIPAFYGEWFMHRLNAGGCQAINPWNQKPYTVSLQAQDVDGFVFWTRNLAPFARQLPKIADRTPFYIQYTVTGYPRVLERSVVPTNRSLHDIREAARSFGPRVVIWRYDPIVITSRTPPDWHLENFRSLARSLEGDTDEVTISFMHPYRKTLKNLTAATEESDFQWRNPELPERREMVEAMGDIAQSHGMRLTVCSQADVMAGKAVGAACIDASRLSDIAGETIKAAIKGNRPNCLCSASRDIGAYDTCPHGCVYCYAVSDTQAAKRQHAAHEPLGTSI